MGAVTLPLGVTLDPGGIGKGFAADLTAAALVEAGAAGALVDVGGDLSATGCPPAAEGWAVTVPDPLRRSGSCCGSPCPEAPSRRAGGSRGRGAPPPAEPTT